LQTTPRVWDLSVKQLNIPGLITKDDIEKKPEAVEAKIQKESHLQKIRKMESKTINIITN